MKVFADGRLKVLLMVSMTFCLLASCSDEPKQNASQTALNAQAETSAKLSAAKELAIPTEQGYVLKIEPAAGQRINQPVVHLYGRAASPEAKILLNGWPLPIDKEGYFQRKLTLQPGENHYTFRYENKAKGKVEERKLAWTLDMTPPFFRIRNLTFDHRLVITKRPLTITGDFVYPAMKGAMAVENGVHVTADGKPLVIAKDRRSFSGVLKLTEGEHEVEVVAKDPAGNVYKRRVPVSIHASMPSISVSGYRIVHVKGMPAMLRITGMARNATEVIIGNRPVPIADKDGSFEFDIPPDIFQAMYNKGFTTISARDRLGRESHVRIPHHGDFVAPYWEFLRLIGTSAKGAVLEGRVSEPGVSVRIGGIKAVADSKRLVRVKGVTLKTNQRQVATILRDQFGNESHIDQWIRMDAKLSMERTENQPAETK